MKLKRNFWKWLALIAIIFLAFYINASRHDKPSAPATSSTKASSSSAQNNKTQSAAMPAYPTDTASSLWVVVNKGRQLPSTYIPDGLRPPNIPLRLAAYSTEMQLRPEAAKALEQMAGAAKTEGLNLMLASGYRSYSEQVGLYNGYVKNDGQASADAYSARPGHSEHQTGLAADLEPASRQCEVEDCFADTAEGKWLATNSYKYGFIIRYQKNNEKQTGYKYEPWHVRYVGTDLAKKIYTSNKTLEQYFGLPAFATYPAESTQLKDQ